MEPLEKITSAGALQDINQNFERIEEGIPFALAISSLAGEAYFVDLNAGDDDKEGNSWGNAFKSLSVALAISHANIASKAAGWAARNRVFVKADQTKDVEGEDLVKLAQKTDIIGVGSVDHLLGARIIGNHVIDSVASYMGCRFINMIFKCPAAGGDMFTIPTAQSGIRFLKCLFDAESAAKAGGAIIATALESLSILDCEFMGQFSDAVIEIGAGESNSLHIARNIIEGADVGIDISSGATCSVRAGRILDNVINTTGIGINEASGKFYVHGNRVVTKNATGAAGAGAIVAGAKMMLGNKVSGSNAANCDVPALGTLA